MKKNLILVTDIPYSRFALHLTNLIIAGISPEIFPKTTCKPSEETKCVVAYSGPIPEDVINFVCSSNKKHIHLFLAQKAADSFGGRITLLQHMISSEKEASLHVFSAASKYIDAMRH